jgi:hypothetical protein
MVLFVFSPGFIYSQGPATPVDQIVTKIFEQENLLARTLVKYSPLIETYIQHLDQHEDLHTVPKSDRYFLGKLDLSNGMTNVVAHSLLPEAGIGSTLKGKVTQLFGIQYLPAGFAQMMVLDATRFDRETYAFEYVRQEFLGEVRTLVFEVQPRRPEKGRFSGRIWVEDRGYNIVRFNGTYGAPKTSSKMFFHFDSWRENMGPNQWLPAYIYTEESDLKYLLGRRKLQFKGQTRLWGYNIVKSSQQNELTSIQVDSDQVTDNVDVAEGISPVLSLRAWERQAEDNALQRMEKAGVVAPVGEVDKVLETVINNLVVTNSLTVEPPARARVLLTAPLESFTVGHTIVLSRGLIDVLPDEASLAMVLAHELGHIVAGHRLDTKYAFGDRMLFKDYETFRELIVKRTDREEEQADEKAAEFLKHSPYNDKLGNAGLFLKAVDERAKGLPNLLSPHMGNRMTRDSAVVRMADLKEGAPELQTTSTDQIAALPLGGRIKVNAWDNKIELVKSKPVALMSAREKMPFEITPVFLYLTRQTPDGTSGQAANQ